MRSLALMLLAVAVLLASTAGQAQDGASLAAASTALSFVRVEWGITGEVKDDCFYVKLNGDPTLVAAGDLRVTKCQTKKVGTLVAAGDAEVVAAQKAVAVALTLSYVDLDSTGAFSPGDAVYADTDPGPGFAPATSNTSFTLRLTAQPPDLTAGTIVRSYERDANAVSVNLPASSFGFADGASGSPSAVDASDAWFILPGTAPGATGAVPPASVRLRNDGPFGTLTQAVASSSSSSSQSASDSASPSPGSESRSESTSASGSSSPSASPEPDATSSQTSTDGISAAASGTGDLVPGTTADPGEQQAETASGTGASLLGDASKQARGSGLGPLLAVAAVGAALLFARRRL